MPAQVENRMVVTCPHCKLVQFETKSGDCRKCGLPLKVSPPADASSASSGVAPAIRREPLPHFSMRLDFAGAFRVLRLARGLSQRDLAKRLGCPRTYVSKIERHRDYQPVLATIERIARALEVSAAQLIGLTELLGRASVVIA